MKNCIVKRLKSTVDNENLPYLDSIVIHAVSDTSADNCGYIAFRTLENSPITIITSGDGVLSETEEGLSGSTLKTITFTSVESKNIYFSKGDYNITVRNRNNINRLSFGGSFIFDLTNLKYCKNLNYINGNKNDYNIVFEGNLNEINNCTELVTISFTGQSNIVGNISSISNIIKLRNLYLSAVSKIEGNLESLSTLNLLTTFVTSPKLEGSLKGFADATVANSVPRTSGTLEITCNPLITLTGNDDVIGNTVKRWIKFGTNLPSGAVYTGVGYSIYSSNPNT